MIFMFMQFYVKCMYFIIELIVCECVFIDRCSGSWVTGEKYLTPTETIILSALVAIAVAVMLIINH